MKKPGPVDLRKVLDTLVQHHESRARTDATIARRHPRSAHALTAVEHSRAMLQDVRNARAVGILLIDAVRITCNASPPLQKLMRMPPDREITIRYVVEDLRHICGLLPLVQPNGDVR